MGDAPDLGQQVRGRLELERQPVAALELAFGGPDGAEVGDGRRHDQGIEAGPAGGGVDGAEQRRPQLGGRSRPGRVGGAGQADLDVAGDERHPGAAVQRGLGDGDAHPPGRAIADEPDGVDRLARPADA